MPAYEAIAFLPSDPLLIAKPKDIERGFITDGSFWQATKVWK